VKEWQDEHVAKRELRQIGEIVKAIKKKNAEDHSSA
jgi:hypothetical protein